MFAIQLYAGINQVELNLIVCHKPKTVVNCISYVNVFYMNANNTSLSNRILFLIAFIIDSNCL